MKKIITLILLSVFNYCVIAQDLPKYYIINGDTIGMTLSMKQVKKIKNDLEIKNVLETMKIQCDSLSNKSKNQEKECDERISSKDKIIYGLDTSIISKRNRISSLNGELLATKSQRDILKQASLSKDSLNTTVNLRLSEVKTSRNFWMGGSILFFITTLSLLLH